MTEENLFHEALAMANLQERVAFLNAACAGKPELRAAVEALLAANDQPNSFLNQAAVARPAANANHEPPAEGPRTAIGPYKLLQQIGEGGFGVVYMAEQEKPVRRTVALKVIKAGMDSKQVIARFEAERQALAVMDHPNIATVLDAGTTATDRPYFVMELVKGVPITRYCDEHHLPVNQRLELFVTVCQAIQHAHQKGIIHRDIKPTNVLVALYDAEPVPKVIDFGVAKATAERLTEKTMFTGFGQLIGTLEYMSPEQAQFNQQDIDTRSDIYSLGVLLYELLTGSTPLEQSRLRTAAIDETLRIIRQEEPPKPSTRLNVSETLPTIAANRNVAPTQLRRQVTGDLDWIVMKSLEKDRRRRYETCSAFAIDILRYLHDEPVEACPPTVHYRLRKFVGRNKGPVLASMLVLLALVGGIVGTTWQMILATQARARIISEATEKEAALKAAQQSERGAKDQLFLALLNRARAGRFSRQMGQRLDSLAALSDAARIRPDERLRDEAIAAMALPDVSRARGWRSWSPGTVMLAYGGQYRLYARLNRQGIISIRTVSNDVEIQQIASGPLIDKGMFISPDEQFLLGYGPNRTLRVWRVADGQPVLQGEPRECQGQAFSPDGSRLAVGQQKSIVCFDLTTGTEVGRWSVPTTICSLDFHLSGEKLAVGFGSSNIVSVYDASNGTLLANLPVGSMNNQFVAWHPDGARLAVSGSDPRIQIWNVAAKRKVATLEGHVSNVNALTFHPDGSLLASCSWDGTLRFWDAVTGRPLLQLPLAVGDKPRFSSDGRWIGGAIQGEQTELLEVMRCREYRTLVMNGGLRPSAYTPADISPDGRLLAVGQAVPGGGEPGARLWDLHSGRELATLPAGANYVCFDGPRDTLRGSAGSERDRAPIPFHFQPWSLLTCGQFGLWRWRVTRDDSGVGGRLSLGPPRQLSTLPAIWFNRAPRGCALGAGTDAGWTFKILDLETGTIQKDLGTHNRGEFRALSGDGRWAASSGWNSDRVRLWKLHTGEMAHEWVFENNMYVYFTPDSRALIISRADEFSFWDVETLQLIRRLPREVAQHPGYVAFSPDGRLMALEMAPAVIHLKDVVTGRTVAKLEDPHADRASWQGFTPDGTQLVVVSSYAGAIHLWDLRAIRTQLKEMNLDWDWPEFPPSTAHAPTEEGLAQTERRASVPRREQESYEPISIQVDPGEMVKPPLTREQRAQRDIEWHRGNLKVNPESAGACNGLAWELLKAPQNLRDAEEAVRLAEKAVRLSPESSLERANCRNTLGLAYYRTGQNREAVEILRANLADQQDAGMALDLYFLAMSYGQLGDSARAREYYDLAVRWTKAQKNFSAGYLEELTMFKAEAEEALGVKTDKP